MPWDELTMVQQLNVLCNALAKGGIKKGLIAGTRSASSQLLPGKQGAVVIDGVKEISDALPVIRFALGKQEAERFYTGELGWTSSVFYLVDWQARVDSYLCIRVLKNLAAKKVKTDEIIRRN